MESNSVCNHTSDWQNRRRESNLLIACLFKDRIRQQVVLLPINHDHFNFWKRQMHLEQISPVETMPLVENSSILEIPQFFLWISGCYYGYCDPFCDWWISWVDWYDQLLQLSDYRCPITVDVQWQLYRMNSEKLSCKCTNNIWRICSGYDKCEYFRVQELV